jgi:hypothetical protein
VYQDWHPPQHITALTATGGATVARAVASAAAMLALWEFPGSPWVIAESPAAAIAAMMKDDRRGIGSVYDGDEPRRMRDDEPFTMNYEDLEDIPDGLERDTDRPCNGCGAHHDDDPRVTVTLSCAEWCAVLGAGTVIREFQG